MSLVETNSKILIACWATVIIVLAMALIFSRGKRRLHGLAVLPLTIPPLTHIISGVMARLLATPLPFATSFEVRIVIDLIAALVACLLIGLASTKLYEGRKGRALFLVASCLFIVAFSAILILNSVLQYVAVMGMA